MYYNFFTFFQLKGTITCKNLVKIPNDKIDYVNNFFRRLSIDDKIVIAHIPFSEHTYEILLYSLSKYRPTVNGIASYFPKDFFISRDLSYQCLSDVVQCSEFFNRMFRLGVTVLIIHSQNWRLYPDDNKLLSPHEFFQVCQKETIAYFGESRCLLQ